MGRHELSDEAWKHIRDLLHRSVRVLLFNKKGEVYVQQRSFSKDYDPGMWEGSVAGHCSKGEEPVQTAARETKEELGMRIPKSRFSKIRTYVVGREVGDTVHSTLFVVKNVTQTPRLGKEVIQGHWEDPKHITRGRKHQFRKSFLLAWKLYKK